jgi:hypothetical protein
MENSIEISIDKAVEKLVKDDISAIMSNNTGEDSYLEYIFEFGFKGYFHFTDAELEEELKERFGNKYKIIYDL